MVVYTCQCLSFSTTYNMLTIKLVQIGDPHKAAEGDYIYGLPSLLLCMTKKCPQSESLGIQIQNPGWEVECALCGLVWLLSVQALARGRRGGS